jgi:putative hydroxymethylpyrimidine transport system substrate-binding protein
MRGSWALLLLNGLLALLLSGCGSAGETTAAHVEPPLKKQWNMGLDEWESAATMGVLMAESRGYFANTVDSLVGITPASSLRYVMTEVDDVGVARAPQVVVSTEKGASIVIIGSLVRQPTAALVWLKGSGIHSITDLKGKTIAIPGERFQKIFLEHILARAGLTLADVDLQSGGHRLTETLLNGRADATFGGSWNVEGPELEAHGKKPVITRLTSLGFPPYEELVLIARRHRVLREPQAYRDYVAAIVRGVRTGQKDPKAVAKEIVAANESNPDLGLEYEEAAVEATLPLLSRTGQVDRRQLARLADWMFAEGMLTREVRVSELLAEGSGQ